MKIEVVDVRLVDPNSGLRGFADVKLDVILIRDFRIFKRNDKLYTQPPHTTFKKDGQIIFNPIIELPEELRAQVNAAIISAFFREKEKRNETQARPR